MDIRLALETEIDLLPAIELSAARLFVEHGLGDAPNEPPPAALWAPCFDAGLLWVAAPSGGAPVGFLAGRLYGAAFYVAELDVAYEHQGQGLGRRLMRAAIARATTRGLAQMGLTTARTPPWNAPFYASLGFVIDDDPPPWLAPIIAAEIARGSPDRCAMRLDLAS